MVFCATNWAGFSSDDIAQVISTLSDLSNFSKLTRSHAPGVRQHRLPRPCHARHASGFDTNCRGRSRWTPTWDTTPDGSAIESTNDLYYEGISQGAIMGGALTALEPDISQSVLDVTGMNYSTLLQPEHGLRASTSRFPASASTPTTRTRTSGS